tara:strand:- start:23 stop:214 length:192 start_codon:yes stop_codon:yes gene_type:complete
MSNKLTKAQIIGELLAEEQITTEEAITLLSSEPTTVIYNVQLPEKEQEEMLFGNMWDQSSTIE